MIVALSLVLALAVLGGIGWWLGGAAPPPRSPFGAGVREAAPAPSFMGGLGAQLILLQSGLFRELSKAVTGALQDKAAAWALVSGSFLYGVIHAIGPGHGKMVIASYIIADGRGLRRGMALSTAAALLQALVAIALVTIMALALRATAREVEGVTRLIEMLVFAAISVAGLAVLWRKAGAVTALSSGTVPSGDCAPGCGHDHMPTPEAMARITSWRELALVVVAAGARPCMGAVVVLTFAASQGLFLVGVASVLAMAAGVALSTSLLAALAVSFKAFALQMAGGRGMAGTQALLALECLAAAFVAALGLLLILDLSAGAGA